MKDIFEDYIVGVGAGIKHSEEEWCEEYEGF